MSDPMRFQPPPDFIDPRLQPDFQPEHWPLCNGEPAPPPNPAGLHERRCIEFLAAYYRVNVLNSRLLAARTDNCSEEIAQARVEEVVAGTAELEQLEDRYAPIGFFGEPVMEGIRYHSIGFIRPEQPRLYPKASQISSHFAIPGIDEIPESELRGPVKVIRFKHGKMDL